MGGGAFLLLKTGDSRPESSKQAEIRLAILLKILRIPPVLQAEGLAREGMDMQWLYFQRFPLGMANSPQGGGFVIQITVFVKKLAQYPAWECRDKLLQVLDQNSIHETT